MLLFGFFNIIFNKNNITMKKILTSLLLFALVFSLNIGQAQIKVLTGTEHGTYFKLAQDMNGLMPSNTVIKDNDTTSVDFLDIRTTAGSSLNFELLADEKNPAKVAIMQLDVLLLKKMDDLLNGTTITENLVILMPLNVEDIHLITKEGSGITSLANLEGAKVAIGNKREGTYFTTTYMQNISKVNWLSNNMSTQDVLRPLLLDKIDAFFMVATPPMGMLKILPVKSGAKYRLVSLENINGWADFYIPTTITAGTYVWQKEDVSTFGVPSVIVVNTSKISDEEKQELLKWRAVSIENLENLKTTGHPAWKTATLVDWDTSIWPQL